MKINLRQFTLVVVLVSLVTSCGRPSSGPQAWLDLPLDNTTAPLAPLTIMSHASDTDGVTKFVFYVDGEEIRSIDAEGERLESRQFEWNPPRPGTYVIEVRAFDGSGNPGSMTSALVIIGDNLQLTDILTPDLDEVEDENTETPTPTFTPTLTSTQTQTPLPPVFVQPSATPVIDIIPPAPLDTTPPVFFSTGVDHDLILTESSGCPAYSRTVVVAAAVGDDSGIARVYALWSVGGENGMVTLNMGSLGYWNTIGPVHTIGDLSISIFAEDNAGNTSDPATHHVTVQDCVG